MKLDKVLYTEVKEGDKILPPARELSLWMRRSQEQKGLAEESLLVTVQSVLPSYKIDKGGSWTYIKAKYSMEFAQEHSINFFVRPETILFKHTAGLVA